MKQTIPLIFLAFVLAGCSTRPWYDGGDLSALARLEECGAVYRGADGEPGDAMAIMADYGANCVRLRLFVEPVLGLQSVEVNDLEYTLDLARRCRENGQAILLNFHFSDTFADPHKQKIPDGWKGKSLEEMAVVLEAYTRDVMQAFREAGVYPELVQLGNEIDGGILWPVGRAKQGSENVDDYANAAYLLNAAARAVRETQPPGRRTRIMLHTATGGVIGKTMRFHRAMQHHGVDYDVAGLSYYPWWHGSYEDLVTNMNRLATEFDLEVMACEIGHTWNDAGSRRHWEGKTFRWPKTPEGQATFFAEVIEANRALPDNKGIGALWWQPDGVTVKGEWVWFQGSVALWRKDGTPLPALEALGRY